MNYVGDQDVRKTIYIDFGSIMSYIRKSVGRVTVSSEVNLQGMIQGSGDDCDKDD